MKLTVDARKLLHSILVEAFSSPGDLDQMTQLHVGVPLAHIAAGENLPHTVLQLIRWAEARDRVVDLIEAAREANPSNANLKELAARLLPTLSAAAPNAALGAEVRVAEFTSSAELARRDASWTKIAEPRVKTEVLQRIALQSLVLFDTAEWRDLMMARERAVCRIDVPCDTGFGTGFLIAPDLVMTNYHVLQPFIEGGRDPSVICCRFRYRKDGAGQSTDPSFTYRVASSWLVASSPIAQLDYAIVRLQTTADAEGAALKPIQHGFETGEAIFILQHPKAAPLKVASGGLVKIEPTRVFYLANTLRGSSGSPCFTANWDLVALHRSGEDIANVGVPFGPIIADVEAKGLSVFGGVQ